MASCSGRGKVSNRVTSMPEPSFPVMELPEELILRILRNLSALDKAAAQQACHKLRLLCNEATKDVLVDDDFAEQLLSTNSLCSTEPHAHEPLPKAVQWIVAVTNSATVKRLLTCPQILWAQVSALDLTRSDISSGEILRLLPAACRNITSLAVSLSQVDDTIRHLGELHHLTELHLHDMAVVTDQHMAFLAGLPHLQDLMLHYPVGLTDGCFSHLAALKQLRSLKLVRSYGLEGTGLQKLSDLPQLTSLQFRNCKGVTEEGLESLGSLTSLKRLQLHTGDKYGNPLLLTQPLLRRLGQSLKGLESLEFNSRIQLDEPLLGCFGGLTSLAFNEQFKFGYDDLKDDLSWGWDITPTLQCLLPLPNLLSLRLGGWIHLTTQAFPILARQTSLSLLSCGVVCGLDKTVVRSLTRLKGLHALELRACACDAADVLQAVRVSLPHLSRLSKLQVHDMRRCLPMQSGLQERGAACAGCGTRAYRDE